MKNIIFHIGFHKTGTSWLQDHVFNEKSTIFSRYSQLAPHFVLDREGFILNSLDMNEEVILEEFEKIKNERGNEENKIPIISYERLSGSPFAGGVNANSHALRIKNVFPNARILIVIRNQKDVVLSAYFQYLTGGGTHGIDRFLKSRYNGLRPYFTFNHYDYHHIIKGYQTLFDKENVFVMPYELLKEDKYTFLQKLSEFSGVEITLEEKELNIWENINHSQFARYHFRWLSLFIKSTELNDFTSLHGRISKFFAWKFLKFLMAIIPQSFNKRTKKKLARKVSNEIGNRFHHSNKITDQLISFDLSKYNYFN